MIEFGISACFWMAVGGLITFMGFLIISLCKVSRLCSELEERKRDMILVNNWNSRRTRSREKGTEV